jgi:HEAT repeat protein
MHDRPDVFSRVVDRAYKDPAPEVRREAVRTLAGMRGEGVVAALDAIKTRDADQNVRYEAGVELLRLKEPGKP